MMGGDELKAWRNDVKAESGNAITSLIERLQTMGAYGHKPYPTHYINPDGPKAVEAIADLTTRLTAAERARDEAVARAEAAEARAARWLRYLKDYRKGMEEGLPHLVAEGERRATAAIGKGMVTASLLGKDRCVMLSYETAIDAGKAFHVLSGAIKGDTP